MEPDSSGNDDDDFVPEHSAANLALLRTQHKEKRLALSLKLKDEKKKRFLLDKQKEQSLLKAKEKKKRERQQKSNEKLLEDKKKVERRQQKKREKEKKEKKDRGRQGASPLPGRATKEYLERREARQMKHPVQMSFQRPGVPTGDTRVKYMNPETYFDKEFKDEAGLNAEMERLHRSDVGGVPNSIDDMGWHFKKKMYAKGRGKTKWSQEVRCCYENESKCPGKKNIAPSLSPRSFF